MRQDPVRYDLSRRRKTDHMTTVPSRKPKALSPEAPGGDFFYDELMTAQPEATGEFYRRRLMQTIPAKRQPTPDK